MVHNDRVLKDALFTKNFIICNKKYYPTNIKYYNKNYFLRFYYNVYYHLKKLMVTKKNPVNKKMLFNFCYSNFYNRIEIFFKVIKQHF